MYALAEGPPATLETRPGSTEPTGSDVGIVRISGLLAAEADQLCGWWDGYGGEEGLVARFIETITAPEVGAVALLVKSPGGTSDGLEEGVRRMVQARDETGKPVVVYFDQAGSAAYWIAACLATHGIYGPIASSAGSVGSYIPHEDFSGALAIAGIVETLIADPPGKVAGAGSHPLDPLGLSRLQRGVFACTARFVAAVSTARGLTPEAVRALDADMLPSDLAFAAGLTDGPGSLEDVLALAASLAANPLAWSLA